MRPLELAHTRYATKKYDSGKHIPQEKIEELKEVLRMAPSSINIQPWQFHFVQDETVKKQLAAASLHNGEKINQADLLIVFSYVEDLDAFQKVVDKELPEGLRNWYNSLKQTTSEADLKIWFSRQLYIAFGVGLSTAIALGLDSTPMEGIEPEKYMDILNLAEYRPQLALAVGYGADDDHYRPEAMPKSRRPMEGVVITV